jgi:hypothetical protein
MHKKLMLFVMFSSFLLAMCGTAPESQLAHPIEGLSCQGDASSERGMKCFYTCPDKTVGPILFEGDPSLSLTKGDLDRGYCQIVPQFTSTVPPTSPSPSPTSSPTVEATATAAVPVTAQEPLLAETVSMCDLGGKLINFRMLSPVPDLTGKTLEVQIASQESTCYVNATNPSLLTCSIPNDISFPAHVVVTLDGALVNDFVYNGLGCAVLTTPTPSRIRSYP